MNAETLHDALGLLPSDLITPVDTLRSAPRKRKIPWVRYGTIAACLALMLWGSTMVFQRFGLSAGDTAQMAVDQESSFNGMGGPQEPAEGVMPEMKQEIPSSTECDCAPEAVEEGAPLAPTRDDIAVEPSATGCPSGPDKFYVGGSAGYSPAMGHKEGMEYPYTSVIRSREALDSWFAEYRNFYDIDSFEAGYTHMDDEFFRQHDLLLVLLEEENPFVCHEPYYLKAMGAARWTLTFTAHYQQEDRIDAPMQWLFFIEIEKDLIGEEDSITVEAEPYAVPEEGYVEASTIPTEES